MNGVNIEALLLEECLICNKSVGQGFPFLLNFHPWNYISISSAELVGVAATLWMCIREVLDSNLGRDIASSEVFRGFPLSLHVQAGILPPLGHGRFLTTHFHFIIHISW